MYSIIFLAAASFLVCYLLTPVVQQWSVARGLVDLPDDHRKFHVRPTPYTGGIVIGLAFLIPVFVMLVWRVDPVDTVALSQRLPRLLAVVMIFVLGLADDRHDVGPWTKLAVQTCAAVLAYTAGIRVDGAAGWTAPGWMVLPLTVLWLLACTNAFNLIDGLDGVATGAALFAALTTMAAALLNENAMLARVTAPLVGSLVAFLRYNFNPASIFLGNCGSLTIGFLLGCLGAVWSQKSATLLGMTAPLMVLSVPLLDTTIAVVRRFLRGQAILRSDRGHIHHRLLARGLTPRQVALTVYGFCGVGAAFSLLMSVPQERFSGLLLVSFAAAVWIGVRLVGYVEVDTALNLIASGSFRHVLKGRLYAAGVEERFREVCDPDACWAIVREIGREFGCARVELVCCGRSYIDGDHSPEAATLSSIIIPVGIGGQVTFRGLPEQSVGKAVALSAVMEILPRMFAEKRETLSSRTGPQPSPIVSIAVARQHHIHQPTAGLGHPLRASR